MHDAAARRTLREQASNTVDALVTGVLLAGGAKPLQDITGLLTNKSAPETGTSA